MVRKFWNGLDKTARGNCTCLFIAMVILFSIAFRHQNGCQVSDAHNKSGNPVSGFMIRHMFPCDVTGHTPFRVPAELSQYVGDVRAPRNMGTLPPGGRYRLENQKRQQQQ